MGEPDEAFRVVRGNPTAEEVAALVGVLLVRRRSPAAGGAAAGPRAGPSRWRASALPGAGLRPGPGAWRGSARPA